MIDPFKIIKEKNYPLLIVTLINLKKNSYASCANKNLVKIIKTF